MPNESFISKSNGGIAFVGPDATSLFAAIALKGALRLYAATGMLPTRTMKPAAMLARASQYSGKPYKRGQYAQAADDVETWVKAMRAALPVVETPSERGAA